MFARKLLLLSLVLTAAYCGDTTSICKLVPDFGGIGNTTAAKLPADSKFCRTLNQTCCSNADFEQMKKVWEDKAAGNGTSLRNERTGELKKIMTLSDYLLKADKDMLTLSNDIKKAKSDADPACSTPAYIHRQLVQLELIETAVKTFRQTGQRCWEYTKNLMNGLMCAACDFGAQDFVDYKKKEITISNNECNTFISSCGEHLKAINSIYFYYTTYHRLTFCDSKGRFAVEKIPDFTNFPKNIKSAIEGCMNLNNKDDCVTVCQSQVGFTTMANFEYQNKDRLNSFKTDIETFLAQAEKDKKANTQTKRILENEVAKNVSETLTRLNNYTIRVAKTGLDLSVYTAGDKDGYKDIDLRHVFSTKVFAVAFLWLLFATSF